MVTMHVVFLMLSALSLPLGASNISGEWKVTGSFDSASVAKGANQDANLVCTFQQQNDRLTGHCRPSNGPDGVPVAGKVQGQRVEWRFDIALRPDTKKQTVTYTSTVDDAGTVMNGTFSIADLQGQFTANKQ